MRRIACSDDVDRFVGEHFSADRMCVNGRRKRRFVPARTVHLWYQWGFCASVVIETGVPTLSSDSNHPQIPASTPRGPVPKGEILVRTHGERRTPAFHRSSSFDVCTPTGEPWEPARCCWYIDVDFEKRTGYATEHCTRLSHARPMHRVPFGCFQMVDFGPVYDGWWFRQIRLKHLTKWKKIRQIDVLHNYR